MDVLSGGCGSDQHDVRHQSASNVKVGPLPTTVDCCQCDRDGGAGGNRLEEFGAVNSLPPERRVGERFEAIQAFGQEQNPGDNWCPGKMPRERRVIDSNVKRGSHAGEVSGGGAHLSTAP